MAKKPTRKQIEWAGRYLAACFAYQTCEGADAGANEYSAWGSAENDTRILRERMLAAAKLDAMRRCVSLKISGFETWAGCLALAIERFPA